MLNVFIATAELRVMPTSSREQTIPGKVYQSLVWKTLLIVARGSDEIYIQLKVRVSRTLFQSETDLPARVVKTPENPV